MVTKNGDGRAPITPQQGICACLVPLSQRPMGFTESRRLAAASTAVRLFVTVSGTRVDGSTVMV